MGLGVGNSQTRPNRIACAEDRCCLLVRQTLRQQNGAVSVGDHVFGMAARHLHSGANLFGAEQSLSSQAPFTSPTGRLDPRNADPITDTTRANTGADGNNLPCRLMSQGSWESPRDLPPGLMHIGETQPAGMNFDQDLIGPRLRRRNFFDFPLTVYLRDNGSFHDSSLSLA